MSDGIFRKSSYEKLASPEELDRLLVVISPKGWLALIVLIAVIVALLFWAAFASIPIQTTGIGFVNTPLGFYQIHAQTSGNINELLIKKGQYLEANSPIVQLYSEDIDVRLTNAKRQVDLLQSQIGQLRTQQMAGQQMDSEILAKLSAIATSGLPIAANDVKTPDTQITLIAIQMSIQEALSSLLHDLTDDRFTAVQLALNDAVMRLDNLELENKLLSLQTPVAGTVVRIDVEDGQYISPGQVIAIISQPLREDETYEIFCYMPISMRGLILPGMEVMINVIDIKDHLNETIYGRVESVDRYTESPVEIQKNVLTEDVQKYYLQNVPQFMVRIEPLYSKMGIGEAGHYPTVFLGETCQLRITLDRKSPFKYLIP